MKDKLNEIIKNAYNEIQEVKNSKHINDIKIKYFGKKSEFTNIMKNMKELTNEEKPVVGQLVNDAKNKVSQFIENKLDEIKQNELNKKLVSEKIDVTLPIRNHNFGSYHPLTKVQKDIEEIFIGMGFSIVSGPEIESVYNNFDALNSPIDHPSRSESDTFYFNPEILLRTQTSPVQIRIMEKNEPPIKIIAPGRCFRKDELDATHSPMFHQIEGLVVDKNINMCHLKSTLDKFVTEFFGESETKFRPHFFPFTEPSGEMDVLMYKYDKNGLKIQGSEKWLEILGCGMVHPNVLRNCGIDPEIYSGFAFGMGLDRLTMLKYEIDDIRLLFENDIRFLKQF